METRREGGPFGGGGVPPIDGAATSNPWVSNMPMTQPFQGAAPYGGQDAPQVYGAATSNPRVSNMPMTQPFQGAGGPRRHFPTGDFMQHVMNLEKRVQNMERTIHPAGVDVCMNCSQQEQMCNCLSSSTGLV
ncbi:uncharacterized protein LOC111345929 [Stylophora pistillata]|uniref:uncharacterized protein LOC111345929 n=1 Tax=Stylophora pistillata TaxID=50429 RepID=UPI000C0418F0|nr:uncharacterized protein LOC111345929 [Stylophora pistillata]